MTEQYWTLQVRKEGNRADAYMAICLEFLKGDKEKLKELLEAQLKKQKEPRSEVCH